MNLISTWVSPAARVGGRKHSFVRMGRVGLLGLLLAACGASPATNSATSPAAAATALPSASVTATALPTSKLLEPGDKVGEVTLVIPAPAQDTNGTMTDNCLGYTVRKPGVYDFKCPVALAPMHMLGIGWGAETAEELEDNWSKMKWRVYLDGQEIDLKSFGTVDSTADNNNFFIRIWNVAIKDLTPREYTIRSVFEVQQALTLSEPVYDVGTYDITNHVTVVKPVK